MRISDWSSDVCSSDLHETEAARVLVAEGADLESRPVGHGPPGPLAPAGGQQHSVGIVHLGAQVVGRPLAVLAVEEHRGEGGDAQLFHGGAGIETGAHLHHRLIAGGELEMVGAGHALAVQQGVDLDAAGPGLRLLQPELAEVGKLLLLGEAGVDRSEEHTSELQSLMRISYAVFCLKKKKHTHPHYYSIQHINNSH